MSLRSSKRAKTRDRLLANAIAFFERDGVRNTRLSEVAEASEVSTGTLFNYFATKGDLAEAWVRGEIRSVLDQSITLSADRDRSLRSALRSGCRELAQRSAARSGLRLEAWREAGRATSEELPSAVVLTDGLRQEQARDRVRSDLSPEILASALYEAIEGGLIQGLQTVPGDERGIERCIRERLDLMLDGTRKRNERVSVRAAVGAASSSAASTPTSNSKKPSPPAARPPS